MTAAETLVAMIVFVIVFAVVVSAGRWNPLAALARRFPALFGLEWVETEDILATDDPHKDEASA